MRNILNLKRNSYIFMHVLVNFVQNKRCKRFIVILFCNYTLAFLFIVTGHFILFMMKK